MHALTSWRTHPTTMKNFHQGLDCESSFHQFGKNNTSWFPMRHLHCSRNLFTGFYKHALLFIFFAVPALAGDQPRIMVVEPVPMSHNISGGGDNVWGGGVSGGDDPESTRGPGGDELRVELRVPTRIELSVEEGAAAKVVERPGAEWEGAVAAMAPGEEVGAGAEAKLRCSWRLPAGAALYSTKWYKDGHEFLRYMPAERPPLLAFPAPGVNLQAGSWSPEVVGLRNLSVASAGLYRCEVSTEGPAFRTAFDQQPLSVVAPPPGEPRVSGLRDAYAPGETVEANCSARRSHPPPHLTWYINGIKAERWFPGRAPSPVDAVDSRGLVQRTLPLRLRAERRLFLGAGRRLRLRCEATAAAAGLRWERLFTPRLLVPSAAGGAASGAPVKDGGPAPAARQTEPRARARPPPHDDAAAAAELSSSTLPLFVIFSYVLKLIS